MNNNNDPYSRAEEIFQLIRKAVNVTSYEVILYHPDNHSVIFNFVEFPIEDRINFDIPIKYVATKIAQRYIAEMIDK